MHDPDKPTPLAMDRTPLPRDGVFADWITLDRLYARFDMIARGLTPGNSSAAHQSVLYRLGSNRRRAEALGWTAFTLERVGGTGRLELRGAPAPGDDRELVPDAIPQPSRDEESDPISAPDTGLPHVVEGHMGGRLARLSWRTRMRWLDDGGR